MKLEALLEPQHDARRDRLLAHGHEPAVAVCAADRGLATASPAGQVTANQGEGLIRRSAGGGGKAPRASRRLVVHLERQARLTSSRRIHHRRLQAPVQCRVHRHQRRRAGAVGSVELDPQTRISTRAAGARPQHRERERPAAAIGASAAAIAATAGEPGAIPRPRPAHGPPGVAARREREGVAVNARAAPRRDRRRAASRSVDRNEQAGTGRAVARAGIEALLAIPTIGARDAGLPAGGARISARPRGALELGARAREVPGVRRAVHLPLADVLGQPEPKRPGA